MILSDKWGQGALFSYSNALGEKSDQNFYARLCGDRFALLFETKNKPLLSVKNRQFIINEFFAKNYNADVTLYDLAQELCLGIKQTEREVKKYTGNSFRDELRRKRIEMANILMKTTDFPLTKISELVGYTTYSGFFKATSQFAGREKE